MKVLRFFAINLILISLPGVSFAVDSCPSAESLVECMDMNITTCREDANCAGDREQGLTVTDVLDSVSNKCCFKSAKRQARCIKREKRRANRARSRAPLAVRPFLRQLRTELLRFECETNTTSAF